MITRGCWEPRAHVRVSGCCCIFFFARPSIYHALLAAVLCAIAAVVAVVVAVLRGLLSGTAGVAQNGLGAIWNLALNSDDNKRLLGAAGACEGKWLRHCSPCYAYRSILSATALCVCELLDLRQIYSLSVYE